ncbi:MAG: AI-2E family transporter [Candidatus Nanohalobium sp.]
MDEGDLRTRRETLLVLVLLFLGSLIIIYPFLDSILFAVAISYLLSFAHTKLNERLENELLSSIIVIATVLGTFTIGIYFFINNAFYIRDQFQVFAGSLEKNIISFLKALQVPQIFIENVRNYLSNLSTVASELVIDVFFSLPAILIDIGIFLVTSIFLYRDRSKLKAELEGILKGLPEEEETIIRSLIQSIDSIFRGVFVTQTIVTVVMTMATAIGFYIISLLTTPMPLIPLWSLLVGLAALLPLIAGFMIYGPVGLYYLAIAQEPIKGSLILIYGIIFLQILPEIFLRPYIGSKSLNEHPLIVFIGFLAGPPVLGLKGLILGPLILILTKEFMFNYANLVSASPGENRSEDKED